MQLPSVAQPKSKVQTDAVFSKFSDGTSKGFNASKPYYIIVSGAININGLSLVRRIDEQYAIIEIPNQKTFDSLKALLKIGPASDLWKLSPSAEKLQNSNDDGSQKIILSAKDQFDFERLKTILRNFTLIATDPLSLSVIIVCHKKDIKELLLPLKEIIYLDLKENPHEEINIIGYDRSFHGINAVDYLLKGANGKNIVAGVKEQKMDEKDLDLFKRVLSSPIAASTTSYHATVISSIIGGAGNSYYSGRGIANACYFFPSTFENLFADDTAILRLNKVSVQNHSYGTIIQQFYGAEAVSYDALCWANKTIVPVFSAGNQGILKADEGPYANIPGFANITGNFKMAKNVITVGAIDSKGNLPPESSSGPLYDGRIAPQLIALGPNGTSDAAAVVSGTIAVMQQVFSDSNQNSLPPSSLTKAILYNNAEDIYNPGIDYKTGFGLLDSYESIISLQQKKYDSGKLITGEEWKRIIPVAPNTVALKVTLAWTDTTATANNNKALINDLDLQVKELSTGIITVPWVLNTSPNVDSLVALPVRKRDSLNTAEQVSIELPAPGDYEIKVTATTTGNTPVPFHIAFKTDTLNTFRFINPLHASDVNRDENENLVIKWKTFVADSNESGNLFISFNSGNTWQLLASPVKLSSKQYEWQIKDTSCSAILKMETAFGDFVSRPFIISKPTKPVVNYVCADSSRLSWEKHYDATNYKIFALADSPYLKQLLTVNDTFMVLHKTKYPYQVYAVEPVLNSGLKAARSIAQDITIQGVECFYRTFYYNLFELNKLELVLELSLPESVDSIYFEKVNNAGQLLEVYGTTRASAGQLVYKQAVNSINQGTTYLRVRLKLKSGAIVYTEIINVVSSGNRYLLFYPNPVSQNEELHYTLQQGIPSDCKLLFFDMSGRMVKNYSFLPITFDLRGLAAGIYIYRLFDPEDALLETGKLVIQ